MGKLRIAMLISGGGTTMREIIKAVRSGFLRRVEPALVIASSPDAGGIEKAIAEGIDEEDVLVMRPKDYPAPEAFGNAIIAACKERTVDFIGQYGWMAKTPRNVIEAFPQMMVNQHPGPLDPGRPDFGGEGMFGRRVHHARLYFIRHTRRGFFTEATAQRVAPEYDRGAVLARVMIPVFETDLGPDGADALQARVLPEEHRLQVETLLAFAEGEVRECTRSTPLVRSEAEEQILREAKKIAGLRYPHG